MSPDILAAIGNTPLVAGARMPLLFKLENHNPGQSTHDRTALTAVLDAEETGRLPKGGGGWIAEPADTVAALSLAMVAAARGHTFFAFVPSDAPFEFKETLRLYGARVTVSEPHHGLQDAKMFLRQRPGSAVMPALYEAAGHAAVHKRETAREILEQAPGPLAALVVPVLSGALLLGLARAFKQKSPQTKIVAAAAVGPQRPAFPLGAVPALAAGLCDRTELVSEEECWAARALLAREEGILASPTGGAAVHVGLKVAREVEGLVAVIIPDSGERWFSVEEKRGRVGVGGG